ncbi:MAG: DNA repair protein RadA [Bdellovibrionales bacterium]|nr:DNA repair protein RadA [Bdellovibrionales bacterium]
MAKAKTHFVCQECGSTYSKWSGQCRGCHQWNTLVEETLTPTLKSGARGWSVSEDSHQPGSRPKVHRLDRKLEQANDQRHRTGFQELDRVLGGGLVPGSFVLLGGDPGIGKSTLLLQMAGGLAKNKQHVLYISGEESVHQSALRAQRLGITSSQVEVASESLMENILSLTKDIRPDVLIVDSIQTVYLSELTAAPGSVSQVRECAAQLMALAKGQNIAVFIIGHVTKDGNIAGPKTLAHMVDTVLSFEGDSSYQFRLLRAQKNRFGATNELGVFQMKTEGLAEVDNPSEMFLEERGSDLMGSSVFAAMEGSRPLLCEIQGLTSSSPMAMPRRTSLGFDTNRVHLLVAVLDKHLDLGLSKCDVFVNVVGGLKITEPAADLAVAAALISTTNFQEMDGQTCFFGEIGLTGEVRRCQFADERIKEAEKLGFNHFVLPESNKKHLTKLLSKLNGNVVWIKRVAQLPAILKSLRQNNTSTKPKERDLF